MGPTYNGLTREKLAFLRECDLADRVSIILNRAHKKALFNTQQVEDLLGRAVDRVFPNDYQGINQAAAEGTVVAESSPIGKATTEFAATLLEQGKPKPTNEKHKFLEHFFTASSLVPGRH